MVERNFDRRLWGHHVQQRLLDQHHHRVEEVCLLDAQSALERLEQQGYMVLARTSVWVLEPWPASYRTVTGTSRTQVIQRK